MSWWKQENVDVRLNLLSSNCSSGFFILFWARTSKFWNPANIFVSPLQFRMKRLWHAVQTKTIDSFFMQQGRQIYFKDEINRDNNASIQCHISNWKKENWRGSYSLICCQKDRYFERILVSKKIYVIYIYWCWSRFLLLGHRFLLGKILLHPCWEADTWNFI